MIFSIFICSLFFHQQILAQELKFEFLFDLEINLNPPQLIEPVLKGTRIIYPFKDGFINGDKINGKILECSAGWGLVPDSTTFKVDVRAVIETDDGVPIYISYSGYNYANAKTFAMISAGKGSEISPDDYYSEQAYFLKRARRNTPGSIIRLPSA